MKLPREPLELGQLEFDSLGTPTSPRYNDVYHSRAGALEQARHVFIGGNDVPSRWRRCQRFTVCETGFGLGNNFLELWRTWRHDPDRPHQLHVLSFEGHPLAVEDMNRALAHHQHEYRELADQLLLAWPPLIVGLHRLEFEGGRVTLTLAFGKIEYLVRQVEAVVDAFFLDGFSPKLNPSMWSRELFGQLVRIAAPGATAASWCSAGQVRRDLSAAGFLVSRVPGFGGKRDMTRAQLRPGLGRRRMAAGSPQSVVVIGGGLAGAGIAHSLAVRGHRVTVLDPIFVHGRGASHAGHLAAAMTPALSLDDNPMSRLSRAGVLLSRLRWPRSAQVYEVRGCLMRVMGDNEVRWQEALRTLKFPADWMRWCEPGETSALCGHALSTGGLWLSAGTVVRPARLLEALFSHECIRTLPARVAGMKYAHGEWLALGHDGAELARAGQVVIAAAGGSASLLRASGVQGSWNKLNAMRRMSGQIEYFREGSLPGTHAIVAGAGYWLPALDGVHVGGSSYALRVDDEPWVKENAPDDASQLPEGASSDAVSPHTDRQASLFSESGYHEVLAKVSALIEVDELTLETARVVPGGWAGWRAALSDHLPVIGEVGGETGLWVACGYGSRGLSWMTLAGEVLASKLNDEPVPLERDLLRTIRVR